MRTDIPPIEKSQRSGFFDEKVLEISKRLFTTPLFGYGVGAIFNLFYLINWYNKATLFYLINFIFLFYLVVTIIQTHVLGQ